MNKHRGKTEVDIQTVVMTTLKANVMAYVVTAIFILFSSLILTYTNIGSQFESLIVTLGIIVSAFLAGFDTAKVDNRNGYKWGAIGGSIYFVIFLVLGTAIHKLTNMAPGILFMVALLIMITSTIAGMISVNCN